MPNKAFTFQVKDLTAEGEFAGFASIYDIEDLGGDVVERGAFARTLQDKGARRPVLWQHRDPIGSCSLVDTTNGLALQGKLSLGLQQAKDAYILLKDQVVTGLSIGYETVRDEMVGAVRHLKEVRLWEVSLVTFPMLPQAQVTGFKRKQQTAEITRALREFKSGVLDALEGKR